MCSARSRETDEPYVKLIAAEQSRLFSFIYATIPNVEETNDILQDVNVILWRKADSFEAGTNFGAWARKIAHYQVLANCRNRRRDRHVFVFDDELLDQLLEETGERMDVVDERLNALTKCMAALSSEDHALISNRYAKNQSVADIARSIGRSATRVSNMMFIIRRRLFECIERTVGREQHP